MLQNKIQAALQNAKNRGEDEGGFTLIELLVVILIIGILAAIALPTFLGQSDKAKDSSAKSDARNAITQIESALADGKTIGTAAGQVLHVGTDGDYDVTPELNQFKHIKSVTGSGSTYTVIANARSEATTGDDSWYSISKNGSPGGYTYAAGGKATGAEAWTANGD